MGAEPTMDVISGGLVGALIATRTSDAIDRGRAAVRRESGLLRCTFDLQRVDPDHFDGCLQRLEGHAGPAQVVYRHQGAWAAQGVAAGRDGADWLEALWTRRETPVLPISRKRYADPSQALRLHPLLRAAWRLWEDNGGEISDQAEGFARLLPHMQISIPGEHGDQQRFFWVGERSTTAQMFGRHWALTQATAAASIPDERLEAAVIGDYRVVLESGTPRLDDISTTIRRPDGERVHLPYRRLILPSRLRTGRPVFNVATLWRPEALGFAPASCG